MKISLLTLGVVISLAAVGLHAPAPRPLPDAPTITILNLSPQVGSTLRPTDTLRATLAYTLPKIDTARYGYVAFIQFATTSATGGTSSGRGGSPPPTLPAGSGTITIVTPLARVWRDDLIKHPLTCYYYLARRTGPRGSKVVARTGPITFTE